METVNAKSVPYRILYSGMTIPGIGIGTFGSDKYSAEQISNAVYGAIQCGYRLIDCALEYHNEVEIGKAVNKAIAENIVTRDDLFVISKIQNDNHKNVDSACKKCLDELQLDYIDLFLINWPFTDTKPFSPIEFLNTWKQCERLVEKGLVKLIGMSNMTIAKLEAVLPFCKIPPATLEMELHPSFQQRELFDYAIAHKIVPIGYCPIGSPSKQESVCGEADGLDIEIPEIVAIANAHGIHPALVCLKWAVQRGHIPIPFSVKEEQYIDNYECCTKDPLTKEEMDLIQSLDRYNRLIKGQEFLWEGAKDWEVLWDVDGTITI